MAIKQSLEENKQFILDSLPTQELKDDFLKSLNDAPEQVEKPTVEQQVKEAEASEFVSKDAYSDIKKEIENFKATPKMTSEEEKVAIEEALNNPPKPDPNAIAE